MDMITIEPVLLGQWYWLMLIGLVVAAGGTIIGVTSHERGNSFGSSAGAIIILLSVTCIISVPIVIPFVVNEQVKSQQNQLLESEFGLKHLQRGAGMFGDSDEFIASLDGRYVSGVITDAGDNHYVIIWDDLN